MKGSAIVAAMVLGATGGSLLAAEGEGWYLRGDLGVSVAQDTELTEFLEVMLGPTEHQDVEFDAGPRLGLAGGYNLTPWLAVEMETGVLVNSVSSVGGDSLDAALLQVPFLGNVVVQCNNFGRLKPFVGVGAGGLASSLAIDDTIDLGDGSFLSLDGSDTDIVFAYQGFAGLRYEVGDRWSIGLTYRFLGSSAPTWDVENEFGFSDPGKIAIDEVFTHSLSIGFVMRL